MSENHNHVHSHTDTKIVLNRLARTIGHLEAIKKMVERGDDCSKVLIQMAAVRSEVSNTGKILLLDHLEHCVTDAIQEADFSKVEDFADAIRMFVK